jgi:hypothetical protein
VFNIFLIGEYIEYLIPPYENPLSIAGEIPQNKALTPSCAIAFVMVLNIELFDAP